MTKEIKMGPIPEYGDLMTINDFHDCCAGGGFIPDDGEGVFATATEVFEGTDVWSWDERPVGATHVVWFNK
jgi:hypothetical protein